MSQFQRGACAPRSRTVILALAMAAFFHAAVYAQTDLSTIRGTAVDQTGAVVPGATVVLTNIETNVSRTTTTSDSGDFEIPYLVVGTYRLTASAAGFTNFVADQIVIRSRETRRIDVTFALGTVGAEIKVTSGAAVIETEGSQIAAGFSREAYVDSPLSQSTFPQAYMTTLPGVQTPSGGWGLRISGMAPTQSAQDMDGVTNDGNHNLVNNMQDFEDLQVVGVNNSAEFGRVVQVSMTSKGGTNAFHGRAYYNLNNSALNARRYFDPRKIPYKSHAGGINVHGPIIKDKTFFYAAYTPTRIPSSTFYNRNVPTLKTREGDFSEFSKVIRDPLNNQPFAGNQIPKSRISPVSQKVQDLYIPTPNQGSPNSTFQNFGFLHPWPTDLFKWDCMTHRVDHHFSPENMLYVRYIDRISPYVLAGAFPNVGTWTRVRKHYSVVVSDTHVFSPTLVNTLRWGWIKDYYVDGNTVDGYTPVRGDKVIEAIGLQGLETAMKFPRMGFPEMAITGVQTLSSNRGGVNQNRIDQEFADSVTWSAGRHVVKFGGELRRFRDKQDAITADTFGRFAFNGSFTGEGYGDFLLGIPLNSRRDDPLTNRVRTSYELGLFVTDTFKVSRRLTLDYGLRWDYFGPSTYRDGMMYNWDPGSGAVIVPQSALNEVSPLYDPRIEVRAGEVVPRSTRKNIRPRLGLAYRLRDDMSIRGGYGAFTEALGNFTRIQGVGPFRLAEVYVNAIENGQPLFAFPNPFPSGLTGAQIASQSVSGYPMTTESGVIHQFNVSLEKEFGNIGTRLSYIGSRSRGLNYTLSLNKPQPSLIPFSQSRRPWTQFVGTSYAYSDGRQNYDALQVEVQKKAGDVIFAAHYTLANNMADYLNLENPYDHVFWNRDQYTSRNRAVINLTYDIPVGRRKRHWGNMHPVLDNVLGGWQIGWISYFQSGQYFSPSFSGSDPSNTNTVGGHPDRIGDGNLEPGQRDRNRWFDASAFVVPPAGRFGNSGVNILEGPGLCAHHLSAVKRFNLIGEKVQFVYQAMISDLFNTPHFTFPNADISVPAQVGRVFALRDGGNDRELTSARSILMRFRIEF